MFGSEILEVAIGLVLVFLLVSLVLTAVQEVIESILRSRAADLNRAIFELLQNDKRLVAQFYNHPLIFALHRAGVMDVPAETSAGAPQRTSGTYQAPSRAERKRLPAYIPREAFAATLTDLLGSGETTNPNLVKAYDTLNRLSGRNLARVRSELEGWYDGAMDRASGWYKRRTQRWLFGLGLASALLLNINAITVGRYLATDQDARALVAKYAEAKVAREQGAIDVGSLQQDLQDSVGLPIGWSTTRFDEIRRGFPADNRNLSWAGVLAALALALGYLVTAFAATLGAPFWFDVLNRIMVIRSTVKPKEKSPDEPSEDGGVKRDGAGRGGHETAGAPGPAADPSAPAGGAAPARAPSPLADMADGDELDGCLAEHDLDEEDVTEDADLPPSTGGVAMA